MAVNREPIVFGVAGLVFGFVIGYMVASMDERPGPRPVSMTPQAPARPAMGGAPPGSLDADELRALESMATRDAQNPEPRVQLGNAYMDAHRYNDAIRWYREALALKPDLNDVRVDLGACLTDGGNPAEGLKEFEETLRRDPGHKKAGYNQGIALMQLGRPQEAIVAWEALVARYPGDPQIAAVSEQIARLKTAHPEMTGAPKGPAAR